MLDALSRLIAEKYLEDMEERKRTEKELTRALGAGARHYTRTYTAYCRSLWEHEGEENTEGVADTLEAAVAAAASAFAERNKRRDWQVGWRATCTIARNDKGWQKVFAVTPSIHLQRLIPGGSIDHPYYQGVMVLSRG